MGPADGHEAVPARAADPTLVERDRELRQLDELTGAVRAGRGAVVVVQGVAGIGKTQLLRVGASHAEESGMRVLYGRGSTLEQGFSFGVVRQLLEPLVRAADAELRQRLFAGSAAHCAPMLLGQPADGTVETELFGALNSLYWLLVNACEEAPHLLVIDDLQWVDDASQRFAAFVAARASGLPLGVLVAVRADDTPVSPPIHQLERDPDAVPLRLAPLTAAGVARLVSSELGAEGDDAFVHACSTATGGIPFYVHELLAELARDGVVPEATNAHRIESVRPGSVTRSVLVRIAQLPGDPVAVAHAIAVLEGAATERRVSQLAGVPVESAARAIAGMQQAGVLAADGLEFAHPIVGSAVYDDMATAARRALHGRAGDVLRSTGARTEQIAAQLRRAAPGLQRWAIDVLRSAAQEALERGTPTEAIGFLARAAAEPVDGALRHQLLFELGAAELRAGHPAAADHLREALAAGPNEPWWGDAVLAMSRSLMFAGRFVEAVEALDRATASVADGSSELALRLQLESLLAPPESPQRGLERIAAIGERCTDPSSPVARLLLGAQALYGALLNDPVDVVAERARRAWGSGDLLTVEPPASQHYWPVVSGLICGGELETAEIAVQALMTESRSRGSIGGFAMARLLRAHLGLQRGALLDAGADALDGLAMAPEGYPVGFPVAVGIAVESLVERGELTQAEDLVAAHPMDPEHIVVGFHDIYLMARSLLHMARRRWHQAHDDLMAAGRSLEPWPGPALLNWRPRAALTATALGRQAEAAELARTDLELATGFGCPRTLGIALRVAGTVTGGDDGLAMLTESALVLDGTPFELEAARAEIDLGAALRANGAVTEARTRLRRGLDLASHCHAVPLAERARQELIASGARPRRSAVTGIDALTPTERRVCLLAADGLTNRDIAHELFVAVKTVEVHLTNSYRKLGIGSRAELPGALDVQ